MTDDESAAQKQCLIRAHGFAAILMVETRFVYPPNGGCRLYAILGCMSRVPTFSLYLVACISTSTWATTHVSTDENCELRKLNANDARYLRIEAMHIGFYTTTKLCKLLIFMNLEKVPALDFPLTRH